MIENDRYVTVMLKVSRKDKRNPKHVGKKKLVIIMNYKCEMASGIMKGL